MARTKRKANHLNPPETLEAGAAKQRIYRAGGYARLSVEDSGKPGADTIESQKGIIADYIENQADMEFCGMYCDNGQTGVNFDRPGFEKLMQDVRAGKIDCIVVKDLSRFGRNYRETGNYLERIFPFLDVRFVALADSFDTLTAERTGDGYIVPLKNIINEVYSRDISRKTGTALAVKQRRGEFIGSWAAYGYKKCADDPHRIEPDAETAPVVREIFHMRSQGMSYRKIARELNGRGIPAPSRYHYLKGDTKCARYADVVWQMNVVKQMLSNKVYLGHMVQGRKYESFYEEKKQRVLPETEWTVVYNTHEPVVNESVFSAVQKMAEEQRAAYQERLGKYDALGHTPGILKKLVYCADCGRRLTRYKSVTCRGTKKTYFYVCPKHAEDPGACPKKYMPEDSLLEILWDTLKIQIEQAGEMSGEIKNIRASAGQANTDAALEREAAAAVQELKRAQMLYDGLYPVYAVDRALTEHEYMQMRREYHVRIEQAEKALETIEEKKRERAARMEENLWLEACAPFSSETGITEEMAHALISRVEVSADNSITVRLRWQDEYRMLADFLESEKGGGGIMTGMGTLYAASGKALRKQGGRITVARYLRISDEDADTGQAAKTESDSIANQRDLLTEFISRMPEFDGADIIEFCDDGWSGKNFTRPAVREMLEQAGQGKIQCIVVKDLSRFGRNYLEVGNYISRVFPFLGIRFIAVNDGFDSIRPMDADSLETSFKTLLYDIYSRDISRKVRSAKKMKAEKGEFLSPPLPHTGI